MSEEPLPGKSSKLYSLSKSLNLRSKRTINTKMFRRSELTSISICRLYDCVKNRSQRDNVVANFPFQFLLRRETGKIENI